MLFERKIRINFSGIKIPPVEKLRISFEVEKSDGSQMNHALIRIYNLNPSSRHALARVVHKKTIMQEPVITCHLAAGYQGELRQLISGDIYTATNQRVGPDWITDIELFTGIGRVKRSASTVSYALKTSAKQIVDELLAPLGLIFRFTSEAFKKLTSETVLSYSASNLSTKAAAVFLDRYRLGLMIEDDNQGLVYALDYPRDSTTANDSNTFSIKNGLIGSPKVTITGVEFQSLLRPTVKILQRVFVESETINETLQNQNDYRSEYYVTGLKHIGDTHSDEWYTEIEGAYVGVNEGNYGG